MRTQKEATDWWREGGEEALLAAHAKYSNFPGKRSIARIQNITSLGWVGSRGLRRWAEPPEPQACLRRSTSWLEMLAEH